MRNEQEHHSSPATGPGPRCRLASGEGFVTGQGGASSYVEVATSRTGYPVIRCAHHLVAGRPRCKEEARAAYWELRKRADDAADGVPCDQIQGFTVIEVLVAVLILGLAYVAVLQNFSLSLRNIGRVDEARTQAFTEMLAFEEILASEDPDAIPDGELFLEGNHYRLLWIDSEDGRFSTLIMERL